MPSITVNKHKIIYTVTKVQISGDTSVTGYKRDPAGLKEVLVGIAKKEAWGADFEVDAKKHTISRVKGFQFPIVDKHPGHVHASGAWKYNVETGNNTVDRLVLEKCTATLKNAKFKEAGKIGDPSITVDLEISGSTRVLVETH